MNSETTKHNKPTSIADQVRQNSEEAGKLILPPGIRAVACGGESKVTLVFCDGSELALLGVRFSSAYHSKPGEVAYTLDAP